MRAKFGKSFRFKIIYITLLSLFCSALTVHGIYAIAYVIGVGQASMVTRICVWAIISFISFICFFTWFTADMVDYLKEIANGIARISAGDFETNVRVRDNDELSTIAYSVNKMRCRIHASIQRERDLEKAKNELITNVAHDLKTPLTSMIGYLEFLQYKENLSAALEQKYLQVATQKAKRLQILMDELFDYTRFHRDKIILHPEPMELGKFTTQLLDEFYPELNKKELECRYTSPEKGAWIIGDGDLLARAIGNILTNSIKYGYHGNMIDITVYQTDQMVSLSITNYGEMIPETQLDKIFNQFYRLDHSRSEHTGGTGLGLPIAKNIVEMHDGSISVTSDQQKTTFTIMIPRINNM